MGLGYYLHNCSLPIVRAAKNPEKSHRDVFIGYLLVFLTYAVLGTLGYIGFTGYKFESYKGEIDQNCLNMFNYAEVGAFILRLAIFMLLFSGYPLVHYFLV